MNKPIPPELFEEIELLKDEDVARVVAYARSLNHDEKLLVRNERLRALVGSIPDVELDQMRLAIEEGCEQVDSRGW